jgi:hypothetical protein
MSDNEMNMNVSLLEKSAKSAVTSKGDTCLLHNASDSLKGVSSLEYSSIRNNTQRHYPQSQELQHLSSTMRRCEPSKEAFVRIEKN